MAQWVQQIQENLNVQAPLEILWKSEFVEEKQFEKASTIKWFKKKSSTFFSFLSKPRESSFSTRANLPITAPLSWGPLRTVVSCKQEKKNPGLRLCGIQQPKKKNKKLDVTCTSLWPSSSFQSRMTHLTWRTCRNETREKDEVGLSQGGQQVGKCVYVSDFSLNFVFHFNILFTCVHMVYTSVSMQDIQHVLEK